MVVTFIKDTVETSDWLEVVDNDDYEPAIEMFIQGKSVGYVNLDSEGVDDLIVALARSQDHEATMFGPLSLR